jgi:hypothetical protein
MRCGLAPSPSLSGSPPDADHNHRPLPGICQPAALSTALKPFELACMPGLQPALLSDITTCVHLSHRDPDINHTTTCEQGRKQGRDASPYN